MDGQRLISTEQAAAYCGLSVRGFRAFAKKNNFPKANGAPRYDIKALDTLIDKMYGFPVAQGVEVNYSYEADLAKLKDRTNALKAARHKHSSKEAGQRRN